MVTRLPPPQRLTPATALRLITTNFPETRHLPVTRSAGVVAELAGLSLAGGAIYDALIGLTTLHHDLQLLTLDTRAAATFRALGVDAVVL